MNPVRKKPESIPPPLKNAGSASKKLDSEDLSEVTWIVVFQVLLLVGMFAAQAASEAVREYFAVHPSMFGEMVMGIMTVIMFTLRRYLKDYTRR